MNHREVTADICYPVLDDRQSRMLVILSYCCQVKFCLCMNGSTGSALLLFNLDVEWGWVANCTLKLLYSQGKHPHCLWSRSMVGSQSQSGNFLEKRNTLCPYWDLNYWFGAHHLVAVTKTLYKWSTRCDFWSHLSSFLCVLHVLPMFSFVIYF
jgi:hypothetical protein